MTKREAEARLKKLGWIITYAHKDRLCSYVTGSSADQKRVMTVSGESVLRAINELVHEVEKETKENESKLFHNTDTSLERI